MMKTYPEPGEETASLTRPYVISWNLTSRCNLVCQHCYLDAGGRGSARSGTVGSRGELDTEQCFAVIDQIAAFAPECMTILTGGEPLLRKDILDIIAYAHAKKLWTVVGTNGVLITETLARRLADAGVRGIALSIDALDEAAHDRFRGVVGAWRNTVNGARILSAMGLPFIIQTTVDTHNVADLEALAHFVCETLGAKVWNLYFLTPTGRGSEYFASSGMSPAQYDRVLMDLQAIQKTYASRMMVNAKCAPHFIKTLLENDPDSQFTKTYAGGAGGCPAGTHYMGIRPNGDVTPCPYLPVFAGNLMSDRLADLWNDSELFIAIRRRTELGGRCGECELQAHCGGCRARAYGMTGDFMAEDPFCTHRPGSLPKALKLEAPTAVRYGEKEIRSIAWDPEASQRMEQVPPFVRGMVTKAVESYCTKNGISLVTTRDLDTIRSRMPSSRVFATRLEE